MSETTYNNDISGLANINELYEGSLIKKWIRAMRILSADLALLFINEIKTN